MTGAIDLLKSERGVFAILMLVTATILVAVGKLAIDGWLEFAKWLAAFLIGSKTITTAVETYTLKQQQIPTAIAKVNNEKGA